MAWMNNDGLYIKFGAEKAEPGKVGEPLNFGGRHVMELDISLADVGSNPSILSDVAWLPKGAVIEEVEVINTVAATGTNAVLNVGLIKKDRTTELDYDGILVQAPRTDWDAVGEKKVYAVGVTGIGALAGTALSESGYITVDYDTAAFTAGRIQVRIKYRSSLNF